MKKILVVDDDTAHARMLKILMTEWEYEIHLAEDGTIAVKMVKEQPFDMVLMDMKMVKMSPRNLLEAQKKL